MKSNKRPLAIIRRKEVSRITSFIQFIKTIVLNISNNPLIFVTPNPALVDVSANIVKLELAETKAQTRVTGAAGARDVAYNISLDDLLALMAYVQLLADSKTDEIEAIAVIEASGFGLKNKGVRIKPPLSVKQLNTDTVRLAAKAAGRKATYEWRQSADGIIWQVLPITLISKTMVTDLSRGQLVYFQSRAFNKNGYSNWTAAVSFVVQ